MSDDSTGKLHIDGDWKEEAALEKKRLAEQEEKASQARGPAGGPEGSAGFPDLLNMLAMQAVVGLGGMQGPDGEQMPPNPQIAKHYIDLLDVLERKTKGNLSDEEKETLDAVLYELRMRYVQTVSGDPGVAGPPAPGVSGL